MRLVLVNLGMSKIVMMHNGEGGGINLNSMRIVFGVTPSHDWGGAFISVCTPHKRPINL